MMLEQQPLISVVLPAYNAEKYISEAVQSILNQTYPNFEILIYDDGSTDKTIDVINQLTDPRIRLIKKDKNVGLVDSLNRGIEEAKGKYIARMDADDIAMPDRFFTQIKLMEEDTNIVLCGSWISFISENRIGKQPEHHDEIAVKLITSCAFLHPTVILRRAFLVTNQLRYRTDYFPAEDYDLWCRISRRGKTYNIPEVLLKYRTHQQQVSSVLSSKQLEITRLIGSQMLNTIVSNHNYNNLLSDYMDNQFSYNQIKQEMNLLLALQRQNKQKEIFNHALFKKFLEKKQYKLVLNSKTLRNSNTLRMMFYINYPEYGWRAILSIISNYLGLKK
jgi:glycosyltransferase involved in cell wall biosynthesis